MPGLLDSFFGTPEQTQMLGLLGAGMARRDAPGGFLAAQQYAAGAQDRALKQQYLQAQIAETQAQAQEREMATKKQQELIAQQARIRAGLPGLYQQPGMTGGGASPQTMGGMPMFSQPLGVTPMRYAPGGFDVQAAMRLGITDPKQLAEYAALANVNRQEVARTVEVDDGQGGKKTVQLDKFGQPVGAGMPGYIPPVQVNQGDRVTFARPTPGATLPVNVSPNTLASNAVQLRGQNMTDARAREANALGRVPAGYRQGANGGLEFIPGGPADPNAAKRAAPTEFQGKAAMFGARAQEADKIITGLDGQYSPAAVNTKEGLGKVFGVGPMLEAGANMVLSDSGQKAEQAQRDFVNAVLRLESGAAISPSEFDSAKKQYFPQPFDSAAVKAQKAQNRKLAIQGLINNARPGAVEQAESSAGSPGGATGGWSIQKVN